MSNTADNEPGEALKACELCGVRLTLQGDYNHEAGWNWWGHPDPEQSNCLLARHKIDTMPDMETPIPADALRWNTRPRAPLAAVEGDAEARAKDIVELVENLKLQHVKRKHHGPFESCTSYSICALANRISAAAASSSAPAERPQGDGWVTFGRVKVDIENETETFERIPVTAEPLQPEGEQELKEFPRLRREFELSSLGDRPHSMSAAKLKRLIQLERLDAIIRATAVPAPSSVLDSEVTLDTDCCYWKLSAWFETEDEAHEAALRIKPAPAQPEGEQDYQNMFSDTNVGED